MGLSECELWGEARIPQAFFFSRQVEEFAAGESQEAPRLTPQRSNKSGLLNARAIWSVHSRRDRVRMLRPLLLQKFRSRGRLA